ncbi:hypothetical protein [Burkholderia sp. USMB20]|uniref:hypothetical protein n=1 Tax=Burkholderia sp. USMB20 TaxID=1571773 RepID=UPI001F28DB80|nr:hypothetical protein [Burkholderia sp. USMB20]
MDRLALELIGDGKVVQALFTECRAGDNSGLIPTGSIHLCRTTLSAGACEQPTRATNSANLRQAAQIRDPSDYVSHKGEVAEHWLGVSEGIIKITTVSSSGNSVTFAGVLTGG